MKLFFNILAAITLIGTKLMAMEDLTPEKKINDLCNSINIYLDNYSSFSKTNMENAIIDVANLANAVNQMHSKGKKLPKEDYEKISDLFNDLSLLEPQRFKKKYYFGQQKEKYQRWADDEGGPISILQLPKFILIEVMRHMDQETLETFAFTFKRAWGYRQHVQPNVFLNFMEDILQPIQSNKKDIINVNAYDAIGIFATRTKNNSIIDQAFHNLYNDKVLEEVRIHCIIIYILATYAREKNINSTIEAINKTSSAIFNNSDKKEYFVNRTIKKYGYYYQNNLGFLSIDKKRFLRDRALENLANLHAFFESLITQEKLLLLHYHTIINLYPVTIKPVNKDNTLGSVNKN